VSGYGGGKRQRVHSGSRDGVRLVAAGWLLKTTPRPQEAGRRVVPRPAGPGPDGCCEGRRGAPRVRPRAVARLGWLPVQARTRRRGRRPGPSVPPLTGGPTAAPAIQICGREMPSSTTIHLEGGGPLGGRVRAADRLSITSP